MKRDKRWQEERKELAQKIERLERRIEMMEGGKGSLRKEREGERRVLEERIGRMEKKWEVRERKERRKNLIVKRLEVKEGKKKEAIEGLLNGLGVEVKGRK